jgi:hypothetical protein
MPVRGALALKSLIAQPRRRYKHPWNRYLRASDANSDMAN